MNPFLKGIREIIIAIDSFIENLDKSTVENIKQSFYFLAFVLVLGSIILGYHYGKKGAKIKGRPMAEDMKKVFYIDIKKERDEGSFGTMLDSEQVREMQMSEMGKHRFPARENFEPESKEGIVEPDLADKKAAKRMDIDDRDRLSEIDRTDDKVVKPEINKIKRREEGDKKNDDIIYDKPDKNIDVRDTEKNQDDKTMKEKEEEKSNVRKKIIKRRDSKETLKPMDKDSVIYKK